jgi:hypothetical protein
MAQNQSFQEMAQDTQSPGIVTEFWQFLVHNKKWWLLPILLAMLLLGGFVLLSATGAAPFIYTLF